MEGVIFYNTAGLIFLFFLFPLLIVLRFNEDAHCPHGLPLENVFDNKIVDEEVWQIFAKHFPFSKAVDPDDPTCDHCYVGLV